MLGNISELFNINALQIIFSDVVKCVVVYYFILYVCSEFGDEFVN